MDYKRIYEIWLQSALGFGNLKVKTIYKYYSSAQEFYLGGEKEWKLCGCFTYKELNSLRNARLTDAENIYWKCVKNDISIASLWDEEYPDLLRNIINPPLILYYKGKLPRNDETCITVIGTRKATESGVKFTTGISRVLTENNVVVVSGGALGIDSAAHRGSLLANGRGVCVLGCGINHRYLMVNEGLRKAIAVNGAVISEYPPDFPTMSFSFPQRNRILSGLSKAVVVVEAGEKGGSLITVNHALEQGREVFAVPGSLDSEVSKGTNLMIKSGANVLTSAYDVLDYFGIKYNKRKSNKDDSDNKINNNPVLKEQTCESEKNNEGIPITDEKPKDYAVNENDNKEKIIDSFSESAKMIYWTLSNSPMSVDEIYMKTSLPVNIINSVLTQLEIEGLIICKENKKYCLP